MKMKERIASGSIEELGLDSTQLVMLGSACIEDDKWTTAWLHATLGNQGRVTIDNPSKLEDYDYDFLDTVNKVMEREGFFLANMSYTPRIKGLFTFRPHRVTGVIYRNK